MDDDEAELEEIHNQRLKTNAGTVLNKRRGVQNKGPAKQSSLFGSSETFSIKKATPGYKTPVKPGNTMLRSLIPIVKTPTANEEIEDSDSDDCMDTDAKFEGQSRGNLNPSAWEHSELKNQNIAQQDEHDLSHTRLSNDEEHIESKDATSFVEGQVQPFDRKYQNSKNFENKAAEPDGLSIARKGPSLLMNPGISNDSPAIQHPQFKTKAAGLSSESKSTPMSAQRLFMASHLKSGLLNTVPSSACRPGTTKGLGPNASQLQQLLKQKSGMTSASVGSSVFEIQSITKFQDVWMAKCSIIDGAITVASKSYDDAYVLFKTECDTMFTSGMKFRCQNSSKFSGPDGLFVCADEVLIL